MPKSVVAIISIAFSLVIGFAGGAILTIPENQAMEELVQEKNSIQKKLTQQKEDNRKLKSELSEAESRNKKLQNRLLKALDESETESSNFSY
jgi:septal ring factor EnvC (AmiA/AmiB activator)